MGKAWTEQDVKQALEEDENCSVSIEQQQKNMAWLKGYLEGELKRK